MNDKIFNIHMNVWDCKRCNEANLIASTPSTEWFKDIYLRASSFIDKSTKITHRQES